MTAVEVGSPADGRLQTNDVIIGVSGQPFATDARQALAAAIRCAETEKGEGRLELMCWRPVDSAQGGDGATNTVTIALPILGQYGPSAPFDCEKSSNILHAAAAYIVAHGMRDGINGGINALGLLATGEEQYVPAVKAFAMTLKTEPVLQSWVDHNPRDKACPWTLVFDANTWTAIGPQPTPPRDRALGYTLDVPDPQSVQETGTK